MSSSQRSRTQIISGRHRIIGAIGRGGFGAVYGAEHTGTAQKVALKILALDPTASDGDDVVKRFFKEAQVTANLKHPNTVRVFDVGQTDEGPLYIAMEMLQGASLEQILKRLAKSGQSMHEAQVLDIAIPVLKSLTEAHKVGLVHRDIKPANIMVVQGPEDEPLVKVLDFGIARTTDSSLTGSGRALGTPQYMSPEQCRGKALDGRADLYALGIMLYRCATGQLPFANDDLMALMYAHTHEPLPHPQPVGDNPLSDGFVAMLRKATAKAADDRYAEAREMRMACEALRGGAWGATPNFPVATAADADSGRPTTPYNVVTRTGRDSEAQAGQAEIAASTPSGTMAVSDTLAGFLVQDEQLRKVADAERYTTCSRCAGSCARCGCPGPCRSGPSQPPPAAAEPQPQAPAPVAPAGAAAKPVAKAKTKSGPAPAKKDSHGFKPELAE